MQSISDANYHGSLSLTGVDQFLTFILGAETYGIDILRVQEIKGWEEPTCIPNMPDYIKCHRQCKNDPLAAFEN